MSRAAHRRGREVPSPWWSASELVLGIGLLAGAALAGYLLAKHPEENRLDAAGFWRLAADPTSRLANDLVKLGSLDGLLVGVALSFLVAIWRDWVRALACAAAPIAAVLVTERVAKPMVGRAIGSGGYTYPSGTITAVAAVAAALYVVAPRLLRPLVGLVALAGLVGTGWAVLVLRWHYPTDVIGGVLVGCGAVFVIDAAAHLMAYGLGWRRHRPVALVHPPLEETVQAR
ncbi:MAG: phosphatase PAP2 family protein [Actinomycetota bacterium]|nr:phosphatase PAP2 family protein [Actinomycetota bacterium]